MKSIFKMLEEELPHIDELSDKQQAVAQSALKLFSEKGFHQTSTKDIASHAQVSEGTVYKHFHNKENLLLGVLLPLYKEFIFPVVLKELYQSIQTEDEQPFYELLEKVVRNRLDFALQNKEAVILFAREIVFREDFKTMIKDVIPEQISKVFQPILVAYIKRGEVKDIAPTRMMYFIFTNIFSTALPALLLNRNITEQEVTQLIKLIYDGLRPEQ
ncbi:TetR/AcrR family transcriptional regulator [Virgibacillus sp. NKC19-3]|uniref:TetR/AcrR family transcriptional regulator n=1 Tax=Virgibacillus saliphilus TaxID=2831674 RepID=UPI001C9B0DB6|nr:TetR/AcrR family transcriptional regulator [Virgibacillus sp. NKC19-3]MBY7144159.1 TetR/AcrR family transcriptional regulator [Virgibacillus sp. NKC19-3]